MAVAAIVCERAGFVRCTLQRHHTIGAEVVPPVDRRADVKRREHCLDAGHYVLVERVGTRPGVVDCRGRARRWKEAWTQPDQEWLPELASAAHHDGERIGAHALERVSGRCRVVRAHAERLGDAQPNAPEAGAQLLHQLHIARDPTSFEPRGRD